MRVVGLWCFALRSFGDLCGELWFGSPPCSSVISVVKKVLSVAQLNVYPSPTLIINLPLRKFSSCLFPLCSFATFAASAVSFGLVLLRVPPCLRGGFCFWVWLWFYLCSSAKISGENLLPFAHFDHQFAHIFPAKQLEQGVGKGLKAFHDVLT